MNTKGMNVLGFRCGAAACVSRSRSSLSCPQPREKAGGNHPDVTPGGAREEKYHARYHTYITRLDPWKTVEKLHRSRRASYIRLPPPQALS
jgi:hypothetical protein